jgi:hypothetical protein
MRVLVAVAVLIRVPNLRRVVEYDVDGRPSQEGDAAVLASVRLSAGVPRIFRLLEN